VNRIRIAMTGLAMAAGLVIPATIAQAAPMTHAPVPSAHQEAAVPRVSAPAGTARATGGSLATATFNGCPSGDVCMYTTSGWPKGQPEHKYFKYGCYNLSNELGTRVIYNVQTGGATVTGYKNFGCSDPAWTFLPDQTQGWVVDITPINSISLNP
jgi:hypothetical protein